MEPLEKKTKEMFTIFIEEKYAHSFLLIALALTCSSTWINEMYHL
jgi:hypothetical protein